jgi:hypothetical protein
VKSLQEGIERIAEAVSRKKGRFALGAVLPEQQMKFGTRAPFALAVGDYSAVQFKAGGFMCMVGMTREHIEELRDLCNEALGS